MCTGFEIAGLALAAAGTAASLAGEVQSKSAMNSAMDAALQQQLKLSKEGQSAFQSALSQSTPDAAAGQIKSGKNQSLQEATKIQGLPTSYSTAAAPTAGTGGSGGTGAGAIVTNAAEKARVGQQTNAAAGVQGYSNYTLQQALNQMGLGSKLSQLGAFANMDLSALPYALNTAQQTGVPLQSVGSIGTSVGGALGTYGAEKAKTG